MFSIDHNTDNFTIIDVHMFDTNKDGIIERLKKQAAKKGITRFISTHPDQDHLEGLIFLDDALPIWNFYCIKNDVIKLEETEDFKRYKKLRAGDKAFNIYKGVKRRWMNESNEERKQAGLHCFWPDTANAEFKAALAVAEAGGSPNNTSIILKYGVESSGSFLWFGDMETGFMEKIENAVDWPHVAVLFAPHHGRKSGRVPTSILNKISPDVIVIGEAPAEHLHYYPGYNVITQNSAGTMVFECVTGYVHIYVSQSDYSVDFLEDAGANTYQYYLGSLPTTT